MKELVGCAEKIAKLLTERKQTIAVAESSTGGLISAALLAVPGASAYFLGGAVVYTRQSRSVLLDVPDAALEGMRPSTEPYALLMARTAQKNFSSTWALAETGATGPTGNRYGDAAGHSCIAIAGLAEGFNDAGNRGSARPAARTCTRSRFRAGLVAFLLKTGIHPVAVEECFSGSCPRRARTRCPARPSTAPACPAARRFRGST